MSSWRQKWTRKLVIGAQRVPRQATSPSNSSPDGEDVRVMVATADQSASTPQRDAIRRRTSGTKRTPMRDASGGVDDVYYCVSPEEARDPATLFPQQ